MIILGYIALFLYYILLFLIQAIQGNNLPSSK
jgi:hypothetical protein